MAQPDVSASEPPPASGPHGLLRKWFGRQNGGHSSAPAKPAASPRDQQAGLDQHDPTKPGLIHRMSRRVVPGLPRAQTFRRQQSERRNNLAPVEPTPDERRAVSVDRRSREPRAASLSRQYANPRTSAPGLLGSHESEPPQCLPLPPSPSEDEPIEDKLDRMLLQRDDEITLADECTVPDSLSIAETQSMTTSQYDALIHEELEKTWILNLSMHFRDRSKREKFFVTYREQDHVWRRVTISVDYRNAPMNSLEMDLIHTQYQRDKSAKIYEAIRESLRDIQFYDTVTNLKLQTTDGRLHVHVVEDGNEIINYPPVSQIKHLCCRRVRERDIVFDSHMSGFVYKVNVNERPLIKKEIPSPDTIEEFLYEINALSRLRYSHNVIHFYGVVVDDNDEMVKGLLISYAEQGALIDVMFEHCKDNNSEFPWATREKWARQIIEGLSDIHESGFVQGDFTLSNIVIDEHGDAKIIDINRRGCPVGWEPPEATPLIECGQRISMYIGVKSDLYQLGMVLWALAMQEDEPDRQGRPLMLGPEVSVPDWYRRMTEICLSDDPRMRLQASSLLHMFPVVTNGGELNQPPISVDDGYSLRKYLVEGYHDDGHPRITTVEPASDWSYVSRPHADASTPDYEPYHYTRGRSPPSPLLSNLDRCESPRRAYDVAAWAANRNIPSSYSDVGPDDIPLDETPIADREQLIGSDAAGALETAHQDNGRFAEGGKCAIPSSVVSNPNLTNAGATKDTGKRPDEPFAGNATKALAEAHSKALAEAHSDATELPKIGAPEIRVESPASTHTLSEVAIGASNKPQQHQEKQIDHSPQGGHEKHEELIGAANGVSEDSPTTAIKDGTMNSSRADSREDKKRNLEPAEKREAQSVGSNHDTKALGSPSIGAKGEERRNEGYQKSKPKTESHKPGTTAPSSRGNAPMETPSKPIEPATTSQPADVQWHGPPVNSGRAAGKTKKQQKSMPGEVPESRKEVGARYMTNYDQHMRNERMSDEDFSVVARPAVSPPIMTTDTK